MAGREPDERDMHGADLRSGRAGPIPGSATGPEVFPRRDPVRLGPGLRGEARDLDAQPDHGGSGCAGFGEHRGVDQCGGETVDPARPRNVRFDAGGASEVLLERVGAGGDRIALGDASSDGGGGGEPAGQLRGVVLPGRRPIERRDALRLRVHRIGERAWIRAHDGARDLVGDWDAGGTHEHGMHRGGPWGDGYPVDRGDAGLHRGALG